MHRALRQIRLARVGRVCHKIVFVATTIEGGAPDVFEVEIMADLMGRGAAKVIGRGSVDGPKLAVVNLDAVFRWRVFAGKRTDAANAARKLGDPDIQVMFRVPSVVAAHTIIMDGTGAADASGIDGEGAGDAVGRLAVWV